MFDVLYLISLDSMNSGDESDCSQRKKVKVDDRKKKTGSNGQSKKVSGSGEEKTMGINEKEKGMSTKGKTAIGSKEKGGNGSKEKTRETIEDKTSEISSADGENNEEIYADKELTDLAGKKEERKQGTGAKKTSGKT